MTSYNRGRELEIIKTKMSVNVHRNRNFRMSHKVLERLRIHFGLGLTAAVRMTADMRNNCRHLDFVNLVVTVYSIFKPVFRCIATSGIPSLTEMAYIAKTTQFVTVKSSQIVVKIRELTTRIFIRPDISKTVDFSGVKKLMPL